MHADNLRCTANGAIYFKLGETKGERRGKEWGIIGRYLTFSQCWVEGDMNWLLYTKCYRIYLLSYACEIWNVVNRISTC